jgi:hypothetical protein
MAVVAIDAGIDVWVEVVGTGNGAEVDTIGDVADGVVSNGLSAWTPAQPLTPSTASSTSGGCRDRTTAKSVVAHRPGGGWSRRRHQNIGRDTVAAMGDVTWAQ